MPPDPQNDTNLTDRRRFWREALCAAAAFLALLGWTHRRILFLGEVNRFFGFVTPAQAIRGIYEPVYQLAPMQWTTAHMLRAGIFPAWTPWAEGGRPLVANMISGVFSPFHLILWTLPAGLLPHAISLVPPLTAVFAFLLVFFYARLLGLGWISAALAGGFYAFSSRLLAGHALGVDDATALTLPLLLTLVELYFRAASRPALALLCAAFSLPFLIGHFETAFRVGLAAIFAFLYFLNRRPEPSSRKWARLALFGAAGAVGLAGAGCQILPALQYVSWSYNQVWRSLPEFGWRFQTIQKTLGSGDVPALLLGLGALSLALYGLRESRSGRWQARAVKAAVAAAALAAGLGALSAVGLDETAYGLQPVHVGGPCGAFAGWLLFAVAVWAALRCRPGSGLRVQAWLFAASGVVLLKLPPLSNLLTALPLFKNFNNTAYTPEYQLAVPLLAAWGLEECLRLWRRPRAERLDQAAAAGLIAAAIALGWAGAAPARDWTLRALPTSVPPSLALRGGVGGLMTPERPRSYEGGRDISGWLNPGIGAADVTFTAGARTVSATWDESTETRRYFHAELPLSAADSGAVGVRLKLADGRQGVLPGPQVDVVDRRVFFAGLAALAALPVVILAGPGGLAGLGALVACLALGQAPKTMPAADFPFRLGGTSYLASQDAGVPPRRVDSFNYNFLQADYDNLYGLPDIRNGGDNLDVLPMIYWLFLRQSVLGSSDPKELSAGLALDGLANVGWLVDAPQAVHRSPDLEEVYRGDDMVVYRNKRVQPRAAFFPNAVDLPLADLRDWNYGRGQVLPEFAGLLRQPGFDAAKTLVLDEAAPAPPAASGPATAASPSVEITRYQADRVELEIDAPKAGYVQLADTDFPGWTASLDGVPVPILRSWLAFRAVAVPAGRSRLVFSYRPWQLALTLPLSALLGFLWLVGYALWRGPRRLADLLEAEKASASAPPVKGKKAAKSPPPPHGDDGLLWCCAAAAEASVLVLAAPALLYWAAWAAFVRQGGGWPRAAGAAGLLALAAAAAMFVANRRRPAASAPRQDPVSGRA